MKREEQNPHSVLTEVTLSVVKKWSELHKVIPSDDTNLLSII